MRADVRRCAEWTVEALTRAGMQNVRLIETPGHPVVYGDWLGAEGAPTILFYGHYDVQPVDPLNLWESPPFEATIRDGEIYARGAADDKGQVFMHFKAIEAHLKQNGRLPVNIRVVLEGEEEVGSANLDDFIKANQAQLAADVVVISDSPMFDRGIPSICYGLRGLVYFQIDVRGTKTDLHSGSFGGAVVNPNMALAQILAQMKDKRRPHQDPGFYDDVRELTAEEREQWKRLPFNERRYAKEIGAPKLFGESGYTHPRAGLGAADLRHQRHARRVHRRGGQDRHPGRRDGEGEHAARAGPGSGQDRAAVRGVRHEGRAEIRGSEDHADARRQAVDDRVRQSVRAGSRPRD